MSTVAFLGLGRMGAPMAANLLAAGHDVPRRECPRQHHQPVLEALGTPVHLGATVPAQP